MAVGDNIQVTEGSGKRLATGATYTENSQTVRDEKTIVGEQYLATYGVRVATISVATLDSHPLQIMAGSSLNVYVRSIVVYQQALATTAAVCSFDIVRLSTAGTGGTGAGVQPFDTTDSAAGATAMSLPSAKGTESLVVESAAGYFLQTAGASNPPGPTVVAEWDFDRLRAKALRIPSGTSNGIAIKNRTAIAGATVLITAVIVEAPF